jgi:pilus assembly protein Flp/PilA
MESIQRFLYRQAGQNVVEYGLLIATIALVVLVGTNAFGDAISSWFSGLATQVTGAGPAPGSSGG